MSLAQELKVTLADVVTLNHRLQGFHWNVTGPDFAQYHELFAEIYEDVNGSIDALAEIESTAPADMVRDLLAANDVVIAQINKALRAAMDEDEQGVANFLGERDDMHKKWRWQLRASLGM